MLIRLLTVFAGCWILFLFVCCSGSPARETDADIAPVLSPAEELESFRITPELRIELVASEPMVQDPVAFSFDGDGRLWVVEMRGFMPDIDGKGEKDSVGRISVLEDLDSDGKMDRSTIYINGLVLPRAIALIPGGALIAETRSLWITEDLDGDLKADSKILLDSNYADGPSPEHSANGLLRNLDNWYYSARSKLRYRHRNKQWERDSTEFRGQWGITHDDEGRLLYNYNWSQLHGDLVQPNELSKNKNHNPTTGIDHGLTIDRRIYPIRPNPAVNRGYIDGTLDSKGRLLEFTAACAPFCYREQLFPPEYYGNVFVCEPSGNLIKRNVVTEHGFHLSAFDPDPGTEFLASTDERFRPVFLNTGPDGALYIADMYRGQVQHGSYVTPYLREQTLKRKLDQPIHKGRIWRIVPAGKKMLPVKKLIAAADTALISLLSSGNGWQRDMSQQLLVERGNKSNSAALTSLVMHGNGIGRLHALWTLAGLNSLVTDSLIVLLGDPDPRISSTALRLLSTVAALEKVVHQKISNKLFTLVDTAPEKLLLQMALSADLFGIDDSLKLISEIVFRYDSSALIRDAVLSSLQGREYKFLKMVWDDQRFMNRNAGTEIFLEMLAAATIENRNPKELSNLLQMISSEKKLGWKSEAILTAIAVQGKNAGFKPVRLSTEPDVLKHPEIKQDSSMKRNIYTLFEWPGHVVDTGQAQPKSLLAPNDTKLYVAGRQVYLSTCAACHGMDGNGMPRFAPPLRDSDWVLGDGKRLVLLLLHGLEGPIEVNGKTFDTPEILPVMPAHSTLDDESIAAVLTYVRNEWGNSAGAVSRKLVSTTRHLSQGRVMPWTAAELNKHIEKTKAVENENR